MNSAFDFVGSLYDKYFPHGKPDNFHDWKMKKSGINPKNPKNIILSLTSHPKRIKTVWITIESLLRQTYQPNKIILYLAKVDFPAGELPHTLYEQTKRGLEIKFVEDYRSATKLIPVLKEYPNHIIVTADDDRVYNNEWLKILIDTHDKYPECIVCPNTRKYTIRCNYDIHNQNPCYNHIKPHKTCDLPIDYFYQNPIYDFPIYGIFEGYAGVLYPPHSLSDEVYNMLNYMIYTPVADDIWFQAMALLKKTKVVSPPEHIAKQIAWAPETDGTQTSGLYHQHSLANDIMVYELFKKYNLFDIAGISEIKHEDIVCSMCNRKVTMTISSRHDEVTTVNGVVTTFQKEKVDCWGCLSQVPRTVLCIGAYDYGNIGDGIYKEILRKSFPSFNMVFICDTVRMNENGDYIEMNSTEKDIIFDVLVIGGGGIIKNFEELSSITYYTELATELKKPYFMISVGIQEDVILSEKTLKYIKEAELVFVRSSEDYKKIPFENVKLYPDLGYLYPNLIKMDDYDRFIPIRLQKKYITLIQTGSANINMLYVRSKIDTLLKKHPNSTLLVMNWGGSENPNIEKDFSEYNLFSEDVKKYYPNAIVYMGNSISKKLKKLRYNEITTRNSDLTPETAVKFLKKSHFVITGRYHGIILSKTLNIPYEAMIFTNKCNDELSCSLDIKEAEKIIDDLYYYIKNASWNVKEYESWTEDDRNTFINKIHLICPEMDIPFIQAMKNKNLYNLLTIGRK